MTYCQAGVVMIEEQQRQLERKNRIIPDLPFRIGLGLSDEVDKQV